MFIKNLEDCPEFVSGDGCRLREFFNPATDSELRLGYSFAHARVDPGVATKPHTLIYSEVYYIISGAGLMHIDSESRAAGPGTVIYIPPGAVQHIENRDETVLEFVCMVDPAWTPECEKVL
ncbi:MAG: cupin domain-containing protein [Elusimicrobiaceae bacterium]|jgi:mannose-6-phosphate isomerase-like protein (cupin superfamily)